MRKIEREKPKEKEFFFATQEIRPHVFPNTKRLGLKDRDVKDQGSFHEDT